MNRESRKQNGFERPGYRHAPIPVLFVMALVCLFAVIPAAYGQAPSAAPEPGKGLPAASETSGVEELIKVLVENGAINKDQASALMEKKGQPGFSPLAALTELLKTKGVITPAEADRVAQKAASEAAVTLHYEPSEEDLEKMTEAVTQDVREQVKDEIKKEVLDETKQQIEAASAPEWTKRIRFSGDMRLRYEGDFFPKNNGEFLNPSNPTQILNSTVDQDRFRVRARLGATADLPDYLEAGIRVSTGDPTNPTTYQQTSNYFNSYQVVMDLAYLKFSPNPDLNLIGGRFKNPFYFTDLVWWNDLSFDGLAGSYHARLSDVVQPFFTGGAFPLQQAVLSTDDKYLFAGQAGLDINPHKNLSGKLGAAFYDFVHTRGIANNPAFPDQYDWTAPAFEQKGNTLFDIQPSTETPIYALAANYRELNITGQFDIAFWKPIHVILTGDYVNNLGFDRQSVERLTGIPDVPQQTEGYLAGLTVGYPEIKNRWDWRVWGYYKYLEADAVIDAFTDDDFHLGGTNAKGWVLGGDLGIGKNLWTSVKWITTNEIKGPPFAIDSLFVDLNYRF